MDRPDFVAAAAVLRPGLRRPRARPSVVPRLADGVPARGAPLPRRLRRVPHRRPVGACWCGSTTDHGQGLPQRLPAPGHRVGQGVGDLPRRADRLPVPRLAVEPRRAATRSSSAPTPSTPSSWLPTGSASGRPGCEQWGGCAWINLDPDAPPLLEALDPMPGLLDPAGARRHAGRVVEGGGAAGQLEAGPRGVPGGLPRPPDPPPAHPRPPRPVRPRQPGLRGAPGGHSSFQLRPNAQAEEGGPGRSARDRRHHRVVPVVERRARFDDPAPGRARDRRHAPPGHPRGQHLRR